MKKQSKSIDKVLKENSGIKLDIGCGSAKQPGFVGLDYRPLPGVDIVQDITKFPWVLPDESVSLAMASHVLEHINPAPVDPRIAGIVDMLLDKKLVTKKDVDEFVGNPNPGPLFMAFMDEVWRIMKPGGQFMVAVPYADSPGYWQDPSHCNGISEVTWAYFDPLAQGGLYTIYRPKPWKILNCSYNLVGNMEVLLEKRKIDKSYHCE